jgi:glyoxylase-like metal-dependent hydrolase (beta-lactamase superfamily II)
MKTQIKPFYDADTSTLTYVVWDPTSKDAVVIDPVRDYDPKASKVWWDSAKKVADFIGEHQLHPRFVLETHAHADHLTGAPVASKRRYERQDRHRRAHQADVQETFKGVFDFSRSFATDGSQFDVLAEGRRRRSRAGTLAFRSARSTTPGHTPACVSYRIGDALFTGDALFMPDQGVGRCDFPKGDARALYASVHEKLYALPDDTRVFVGHDYQPDGRAMKCETTIGKSKALNVQLRGETSEAEFVEKRQARDKSLAAPRLLLPSVQVNIDAGRLPAPTASGARFLRIPVREA